MAEKPSNDVLDRAAEHIIPMRADDHYKIPLPNTHTDMETTFGDLSTNALYKNVPFAIIDYKAGPAAPKAFLNLPDTEWDIGSMGKLATLIAALAVRREAQALKAAGITPDILDMYPVWQHVWSRAKALGRERWAALESVGLDKQYPYPWAMLGVYSLTFPGEPPPPTPGMTDATRPDTTDFTHLTYLHKHGADDAISVAALDGLNTWQTLCLAAKQSDNRCARAVQGQLGIGYINAVSAALGLYKPGDPQQRFRIAGHYGEKAWRLPKTMRHPKSITFARGRQTSPNYITDTPYVATPRTLAAIMNAMIAETLIDKESSQLLKLLLRMEPNNSTRAVAYEGFSDSGLVYSKVGIYINLSDFAYMDLGAKKFGVITLGQAMRGKSGVDRIKALGVIAHDRL